MLQIARLRSGMEDTGITVSDPRDLFTKHEEILKTLHPEDRYNIYFTVADNEEFRKFTSTRLIHFDIDGIKSSEPKKVFEVACQVIGLDANKTAGIFTGHGVQFFVLLPAPIFDSSFHEKSKQTYKFIKESVDRALAESGLSGEMDTSIWDNARVMRMPGTVNRKKNKADVLGTVLQANLEEQANPILAWERKVTSCYLAKDVTRKMPTPDTEAILTGCNFLKYCDANAENLKEELWFLEMGVVSHLPEGKEIAHARSKRYKKYSVVETNGKINRALEFGAITCERVAQSSDACATCPYNGKVKSPIQIRGADYIETQGTGFYKEIIGNNGASRWQPEYEDLLKFYKKKMNPTRIGGRTYHFDGKKHVLQDEYGVRAFSRDHFSPKPASAVMREFEARVDTESSIKRDQDELDRTTLNKINFQNGVLDVKTLTLHEHSPKYFFRHVLPYDYDPGATAPVFERFLHEILSGDEELIRALLEYSGYALSGDRYWSQRAMVLLGESAANGKSTFCNLIEKVLGEDNCSQVSVEDLNDGNRAVMMDGKLLNISEETPEYALKNPSVFKKATGDGKLSGYLKYVDTYSFVNRAKIVMSCNSMPPSYDKTNALTRRLLIVPFHRRFEEHEQDGFLPAKLEAELPGIFNLMAKAYINVLKTNKFTTPKQSTEELKRYREENDSVLTFLEDELIVAKDGEYDKEKDWTLAGDIYRKFAAYHELSNSTRVMGAIHFYKNLRIHIRDFESRKDRIRVGNKVLRVIRGITLNEPYQEM